MSKMKEKKSPRRNRPHARAVGRYLAVLFVIAMLMLTLAYFTQERAFAQPATELLSLL